MFRLRLCELAEEISNELPPSSLIPSYNYLPSIVFHFSSSFSSALQVCLYASRIHQLRLHKEQFVYLGNVVEAFVPAAFLVGSTQQLLLLSPAPLLCRFPRSFCATRYICTTLHSTK